MNLISNSLVTPDGTIITSKSRHDYVTHTDKNGKEYMVDGGLDYLRRSAHGDERDASAYDDAPHELQRVLLEWGTYGKGGKEALRYVPIREMSTAHIKAVLRNCSPTAVIKNCMEKELRHRDVWLDSEEFRGELMT